MGITGTSEDDTLAGGVGNDTVYGLEGNDHLSGHDDRDHLEGGSGEDTLLGGGGTDHLLGGSGDDHLDGQYGADVMRGGWGWDTYYVDNVGDEIIENDDGGFDFVYSSVSYTLQDHVEHLYLTGNDDIDATGNGGDWNNIRGNKGNNYIRGLGGDDQLNGGDGGHDTLDGGDGDDYLDAYYGDSVLLIGGGGNDYLMAREVSGNATLYGGDGNDGLSAYGADNVYAEGGAGNDYLSAIADYARLYGGEGNDHLSGGGKDVVLDGGTGNDSYSLGSGRAEIVELADGGHDEVEVWGDAYTLGQYIEDATFYGRVLYANNLDNVILAAEDYWTPEEIKAFVYAGGGNDYITLERDAFVNGGAGNDTINPEWSGATSELHGGGGDDVFEITGYSFSTMYGDSGRDTFVLGDWTYVYGGGSRTNTIADFDGREDRIVLQDFDHLGQSGELASRYFRAGEGATAVAQDENDRIIFDTSTGALYYDADANGAGAQMLIAMINVESGLLNHTDFTVA